MIVGLAWLALGLSYLLGGIPTGLAVVWLAKRVDIRTVGSGNIGATNAMRVGGPWLGLAVLLVDVLKGVAAVTVVAAWLTPPAEGVWPLACGVAAVVGHAFPVYLKFHGGKGVATTIGALLATMPLVTGVALGVWLVVFLFWRYVSVASLAFAISVPLLQAGTGQSISEVVLGAGLAALMVERHRGNIERLVQHREHRASFRR